MLSGFPFRMVNELQGAYSQFSRLVGGMMQTPHPQAPDLPMAADPRLDLTPYLYRTLEALQKEMSYAGRYRPIDPTDEPPTTSGGSEQLRGGSTGSTGSSNTSSSDPSGNVLPPGGAPGRTSGTYQLPIRPVTIRPPIPGIGGSPGQSMGIGIQQGSQSVGKSGAIPIPGSTITDDSIQSSQLRSTASPGIDLGTIGSADMANKPDLLQQLFPNLLDQLIGGRGGSAAVESGKSDGGVELRNRSSGNSKSVRPKPRRDAR